MQRSPAERTHVSGAESGGAAASPSARGARRGLTWSSALTLTLTLSSHPAPASTTCGWFPGEATFLCSTLPAGGPCDMPRARHTGRPERGALLPALRPHPRTCRPAQPRFPLSRLRGARLPTPRPVPARPRPPLPPRPCFLLSPPSRRTSGSRIPPKSLLSVKGPLFVEVT